MEAPEVVRVYLARQNLVVNGIYQLNSATLNLRATPTLLLVADTGTVRRVFAGMPDNHREQEVLEAVRAVPAGMREFH